MNAAPRTAIQDITPSQSRGEMPVPYAGWAPGNYQCRCLECENLFVGDKRAVTCEACARRIFARVSDGDRNGEDAQAAECEACQRDGEAETPFPTSPLNEGAVEEAWTGEIGLTWPEINARDRTIAAAAFESGKREAESQITALLTNLAEAQRERDIARELQAQNYKALTTAMRRLKEAREENERLKAEMASGSRFKEADIDALQDRLSHLQTRLEEMEGALTDVPRFLTSVAWACARIGMSEQLKPEECKSHRADLFEMRDSVQRVRDQIVAALQPKGESK